MLDAPDNLEIMLPALRADCLVLATYSRRGGSRSTLR